eukprot:CAMPEP_0177485644 /NCGR_PEP_ID=MMETSP0369-20130122/28666_1 /TAXON_ID=447022 ORGANISM="Scrippsiella hangoei-like, Strain SHHI-4" /NCGR_SAMPLE_ID=MMETSP0369 /ASSEMBLY_ACC=CAM_ASM_000364 /LENGTH=272 /DNA_ID=CAMNT_0018961827 /DNA_START=232 /DNA_END=1050 /DNA_ORIENTATION=+
MPAVLAAFQALAHTQRVQSTKRHLEAEPRKRLGLVMAERVRALDVAMPEDVGPSRLAPSGHVHSAGLEDVCDGMLDLAIIPLQFGDMVLIGVGNLLPAYSLQPMRRLPVVQSIAKQSHLGMGHSACQSALLLVAQLLEFLPFFREFFPQAPDETLAVRRDFQQLGRGGLVAPSLRAEPLLLVNQARILDSQALDALLPDASRRISGQHNLLIGRHQLQPKHLHLLLEHPQALASLLNLHRASRNFRIPDTVGAGWILVCVTHLLGDGIGIAI